MSCTMVRSHTRNGHQVRAHSRRTGDARIAEILAKDLDRGAQGIDRRGADALSPRPNPACPHPRWYPVRRLLVDTPYEDSPILAYCCTHCAATRSSGEQV